MAPQAHRIIQDARNVKRNENAAHGRGAEISLPLHGEVRHGLNNALSVRPVRARPSQRNSLMSEQLENPLPSFVSENIDAIIGAEQAANRRQSRSEVIYEFVGGSIGTLNFVVFQLIGVILWVAINTGLMPLVRPFDHFPFPILDQVVTRDAAPIPAFLLLQPNRISKLQHRTRAP